jgi:hypothetical protein
LNGPATIAGPFFISDRTKGDIMAKEPKSLHVKQDAIVADLAPKPGGIVRQDTFPVSVTSKQLDAVHDYITGRIKQHIQEITYFGR